MPKIKLGPGPDPREAEVRAVISAGMSRQGIDSRGQLADRLHIPRSTLSLHWKNIREMRLGELWDMADALKLSEADKTKII